MWQIRGAQHRDEDGCQSAVRTGVADSWTEVVGKQRGEAGLSRVSLYLCLVLVLPSCVEVKG